MSHGGGGHGHVPANVALGLSVAVIFYLFFMVIAERVGKLIAWAKQGRQLQDPPEHLARMGIGPKEYDKLCSDAERRIR